MASKVGSAERVTSTVEQRRNKEQRTFYLYAIEKLSLNYQNHSQIFNITAFIIINTINVFNI